MGDYSMQASYANGCRPMDAFVGYPGVPNPNHQIPAEWYSWVDAFAALGSKVVGVENRERFGYFNLTYQWLRAEAEVQLHRTYATRSAVIRIVQQLVRTRGGIGQLSGMHARLGPPLESGCAVKCGTAQEGAVLTLGGCPAGKLIDEIVFASYGLPKGSCDGGFTVDPSCMNSSQAAYVAKLCVGKSTCQVGADPSTFGGKDPCFGVTKHLSVAIHCAGDPPPPPPQGASLLQAWPCEEQMSKLRLHQFFGIASDKIHRPSSIGADLCVQPEQPATPGAKLIAADCAAKGAGFSIANGHIKHIASGLCVALLHGNTTAGVPAVLASSCAATTAAWAVSREVNQPTFTSSADSKLCLDLGSSVAVGPAPSNSSTSPYLGDDRLFVVSPRGHIRKGEVLTVTAMAFLKEVWNATTEQPPELMIRTLDNADSTAAATWTAVPMAAVAPGRHVFRSQVPAAVSAGDFEYYTRLRRLAFPTLGADAGITVVVV